jgi:hypothetical protein
LLFAVLFLALLSVFGSFPLDGRVFYRYCWFAAPKIGFVPFASGSSMNPGNIGDFLVSPSGFFKSYRLIPELLLGLCAKLSRIDIFHKKLLSTV